MRVGPLLASIVGGAGTVHVATTARALAPVRGPELALNVALLAVEALLVLFAALLCLSLRRGELPRGAVPPGARVDVLVPVRNEDAATLAATLDGCARLVAPPGGFRVVVVDDSDEARASANAAVCAAHGVAHVRRASRRGYKAGALNDALRASDAPFVAVLDVDHVPEPRFLVDALARMDDRVAYVQTVVAWRNDDTLLRRLAAMLQHQFYYGVQVDKGLRERAVFSGSAAVFRREALDDIGGFPEETLVEDFDASLLLAAGGWRARLAPEVGARGLLPWTAGDLARQLWRWSSGTTEVVRRRVALVARSRRPAAWELALDGGAYLAGGLVVAATLLLVLAGASGIAVVRPLEGWSILLAPAAVALAHIASGWQALARGERRGRRLLPLYHLVSLAFTPVLLASALGGLLPRRVRFEGRVAKAPPSGRGWRAATLLAGLLGVAAIASAGWGALPVAAASWVALLGVSFAAVGATAWPRAA